MKPLVTFQDLGTIDYKKAWDYQEELFKANIDKKIATRNGQEGLKTLNHLLFCEHPHVYTLGKSGDPSHLLMSEERLKEIEATYYKINRGGDITYHGPGQLVVYPIFDLDYFFTDIHKYMRFLEEVVITVLKEFGINCGRVEGLTGVWVDPDGEQPRKICAMGVKSSRWVTMHGIGYNINTNMDYFNYIVPCGIEDKSVTSLSQEMNKKIDMEDIKEKVKRSFETLFDFQYSI